MKLSNKEFIQTIEKKYTFEKNPSVAVAVSGGPDSMSLLFLINAFIKYKKGNLVALIVDHSIRFNSKEEAKYISNYLNKHNINSQILFVKKNNVKKKNMNEARKNRYNLLTDFCIQNKILHLFMAHHKDDNLETFLNRKIAGSDFYGLKSISEFSLYNKVCIFRPLLNLSKKKLLDYNKKNKIEYVNDPSNFNLNYTRPAIRTFIKKSDQKTLKEINQDFEKILFYSPFFIQMISEIMLKNIIYVDSKKIVVNLKTINKINEIAFENVTRRIYQFFFNQSNAPRSKKIRILIAETKKFNFNKFNLKGMIVIKNDDFLTFSRKSV
ncbi:tRNA lysidine(34) synthetase TilS [Pelagibacteraceae bacterium]|nr:tRNA lysidine(34) synthetase TilS [Pelagibacteraceae bacterium]